MPLKEMQLSVHYINVKITASNDLLKIEISEDFTGKRSSIFPLSRCDAWILCDIIPPECTGSVLFQ